MVFSDPEPELDGFESPVHAQDESPPCREGCEAESPSRANDNDVTLLYDALIRGRPLYITPLHEGAHP